MGGRSGIGRLVADTPDQLRALAALLDARGFACMAGGELILFLAVNNDMIDAEFKSEPRSLGDTGLVAARRDGTAFATLQQALATAQPPVDVDVWWCTLGAEVAVLSESCTAGQLHRLARFAFEYVISRVGHRE